MTPTPADGTMGRRTGSKLHEAEAAYALFPMPHDRAGARVRRMIGRPASSLFASLLVVIQLLVSPLAHAAPTPSDDCGSTDQSMHHGGGPASDCGDCPDGQAPTAPDSPGGGHHCRAHAACSCPCAHTPALSAFRLFFAGPTPPEAAVSALAAPTFDSPLFDFLRPPN